MAALTGGIVFAIIEIFGEDSAVGPLVVGVILVVCCVLLWRANRRHEVKPEETISASPVFGADAGSATARPPWRCRAMLATIVDWAALAQAAWVWAVIGLGILVVGAVGVAASLRAQDDRTAGANGAAVVFGGITVAVRGRPHRRRRLRDLPAHAMSIGHDTPFDNSRPRPVPTVLDTLRARLDHETFDGVVFSLESVLADLGFGDVRPLPRLRRLDRRAALRGQAHRRPLLGEGAERALEIAGIGDRFDVDLDRPTLGRGGRAGLRVDRRHARSRGRGGRRPERPPAAARPGR